MAANLLARRRSPLATELRRIRGLIGRRRFAAALASARTLAREHPGDREALYLLAMAERSLGRVPAALELLDRLETLHPAFGRLFEERGHCCRALGEEVAAVRAYQRAVALDPMLPGSWRELAAWHAARGETGEAPVAAGHVGEIERMPSALRQASSLLAEGRVHAATLQIQRFMRANRQNPEALVLLARVRMALSGFEDAERLLQRSLRVAPGNARARHEYVRLLSRRRRQVEANSHARALLTLEPANRAYRALYADTCAAVGNPLKALRIYSELQSEGPECPELHLSMGRALQAARRGAEAINAYRAAALMRPGFGAAYWRLSQLKGYRFSREEITRMWTQEAAPQVGQTDRMHLCFALGTALAQRGEYELAFGYYARGNRLNGSECSYDPAAYERAVLRLRAVATPGFFSAAPPIDRRRPQPIFIVGLPCCGAGVLARALTAHSQVARPVGPSGLIRLVQWLNERARTGIHSRYPAALGELSGAEYQRFGQQYLARAAARCAAAAYFIDRSADNYHHIGLIRMMLPQARIIDLRRHPLHCGLAQFRRLFITGRTFTHSLEHIGRRYRAYAALMHHWDEVLPGWILHVRLEDLLGEPAATMRRIQEFIRLPPEAHCSRRLGPYDAEATRDGERFTPWLGELETALGDCLAP